MKHRGRKNVYDLTVVPAAAPGAWERPEPPERLSPEEACVWKSAVEGMKPGWFNPASEALLEAYCLQVMIGRQVAKEMRGLPVDDRRFGKLARLHRDCSRSMLTLATKLRLCPSSNRAGIAEGRGYAGPKPWDWRPRDPAE